MNKISLSVFGAAALLFSGISVNAQDSHQVVRGDTLYGISKRYGVSLQQLMQANSLQGSLIHPGQSLRIPGYQSSTGYTQGYSTHNQNSQTSYASYEPYAGTSSSASSSSTASTTRDYGNQTSHVSSTTYSQAQPQYLTHTVQSGDSLWSIAQRYGQTVNVIKQSNSLSCDHIQCGQQLLIPAVNAYSGVTCNTSTCNLTNQGQVRKKQSYGY